jgi:tetratricopeptide (TPR) repeat protein
MKSNTPLIALLATLVLGSNGAAQSPARTERFDMLVRADFFAGLAGDQARLQRAMERCERMLAENPRHAEALVWHGGGVMFQAGAAFARGDAQRGTEMWERGLKEMNEAVALEPDNVGVRIPRGATLLQATMNLGGAGRPLLEQAVGDYEHVLALQASYFDKLGDHPRGELLFGLAEGYSRLGQPEKARKYFERLVREAPGSGQAPRADAWLKTGTVPPARGLGCVGCHK